MKPSTSSEGLAEFQQAIAQTLFRPLTRNDDMQRSAAAVANRLVRPNDRLTAFERLQIYNQQYWWRLLGSMREDFRGVRAVLGEKKFERLAKAYLEQHGSQSWNLRDLGQHLVAFMEANPSLTAPRSALSCDVARVEWARVLAFDDPAKPVLRPNTLRKRSPETLRLELQPYLNLLELSHPVDELLLRLKRSELSMVSNAVTVTESAPRVRLQAAASAEPIHLAVHRVDYSVYYKRIAPEAYRLLLGLRSGATLGDACGEAFVGSSESPVHQAAHIQGWFATWMELGWLCQPRGI